MNAARKARERTPFTYTRIHVDSKSLGKRSLKYCKRPEQYQARASAAAREDATNLGYRPTALLYCGSTRQTAHTTSMAALLMLAAIQPRQY